MEEYVLLPQKYFNNREIATGIWLLIGIVFLLYQDKTRDSVKDLFHAILQNKILILFVSLAIYLIVLCWVLLKLSLWTNVQAPSTFLWFFLSGVVLLGRSLSVKEDDKYFRKLILDSFKVTAIFEFIVVAYTFNLFVEMLLIPFFVFLGAMIAFSETDKKYQQVKKLFEGIALIIVVILLWHSLSQIWQAPGNFFTTQNGRTFLLPILLTIGSVPFFYLWYCYSGYENAAISIEFKKIHSPKTKKYAKRMFLLSFFFKPWLLQRAFRQFHFLSEPNNENVKSIIKTINVQEERSKNPPLVNENEGWSPYIARDFLKIHDLRTSYYHTTYNDDEWSACSSYINLDDQILPNTISFYLMGKEELVNRLKLIGNFNTTIGSPNEALLKFHTIALDLTKAALGITTEQAATLIPDKSQFEIIVGKTVISGWIEEYSTAKGFSKYLLLSRDSSEK